MGGYIIDPSVAEDGYPCRQDDEFSLICSLTTLARSESLAIAGMPRFLTCFKGCGAP